MEWLNYHHLLYFWVVAREGSVSRASEVLRLSQPTVSGQVRTLERQLNQSLLERKGRGLVLTDVGQMVFRYADEIFTLGRELQDMLKGRPAGRPLRLHVGISTVLPKLVAQRLLKPALHLDHATQVICREDKTERLLGELAIHGLDLVLADAPISGTSPVKAFNHLLGECGVSFMATKRLALKYRREFPGSLDGAPFLAPTGDTLLRRSLELWFDRHDVRPKVLAEFEDSALLKVFGQEGEGVFAVPDIVEREVSQHYNVIALGRTTEIKERFYAISVERKIKHPAVAAISANAKNTLFVQH